ncbi:transaldolase family protein, partial [Metallibacterium sp.]|uniref:transaldolase family protein n=1 Tax=Metallibacterium sp. TaxID=2940281 RepID=UPI00263956AB
AVAMQTYQAYCALLASPRWQKLAAAGASAQRVLWASTGTKDPRASDTLYVDHLIAPLSVNTMPEKTLLAALDHGTFDAPMATTGDAHERELQRFAALGLAVEPLGQTLQQEGAAAFVASWNSLLQSIAQHMGKAS